MRSVRNMVGGGGLHVSVEEMQRWYRTPAA
jgi:hypothetical protein